jgi:hypothetical protein
MYSVDQRVHAPAPSKKARNNRFEILNNPDKRSAFDDGGARQGFQTQWEYETYGKKDTRGFYTGDTYVTSMTERMWEKRVGDNHIWLLEFYVRVLVTFRICYLS